MFEEWKSPSLSLGWLIPAGVLKHWQPNKLDAKLRITCRPQHLAVVLTDGRILQCG